MNISELLGLTLARVDADNEEIRFTVTDGRVLRMFHHQNCCESVYVESIVGDLQDLVGEPILVAEESNAAPIPDQVVEALLNSTRLDPDESHTWTFYKLATRKGYVDIRWYGSSNGYYSESVDVEWAN